MRGDRPVPIFVQSFVNLGMVGVLLKLSFRDLDNGWFVFGSSGWDTFPVESDILLISSSSSCPILIFNLSSSFRKSFTYMEPKTVPIEKPLRLQYQSYRSCSCQICQRHFRSLYVWPARLRASSSAWRPSCSWFLILIRLLILDSWSFSESFSRFPDPPPQACPTASSPQLEPLLSISDDEKNWQPESLGDEKRQPLPESHWSGQSRGKKGFPGQPCSIFRWDYIICSFIAEKNAKK